MPFTRFSSVTVKQLDESGAVKITIKFYISRTRRYRRQSPIDFRKARHYIMKASLGGFENPEIFAVEKDLLKGFNTKLYVGP